MKKKYLSRNLISMFLILSTLGSLIATTKVTAVDEEVTTMATTSGVKFSHIGTGSSGTIMIDESGDLYSLATTYESQVGNGGWNEEYPFHSGILAKVTRSEKKYLSVDANTFFTLAIDTDGNLWATGESNSHGQQGNGTTDATSTFIQVKPGTKFSKAVTGSWSSMAIDTSGNLWAWGLNDNGELGIGTTTDSYVPVQVKPGTKFKEIAVGVCFSMAIDISGNLWSWGWGDTGDGITSSSLVPIQVKPGTKFSKIAGGGAHKLAIDESGNLWGWGRNAYGALGDGIGYDSAEPIQINAGTKFTQISGGSWHTAAIDSEGNLWTWGYNNYGQLGNVTTTDSYVPVQVKSGTKFKEVKCGPYFTFAIDESGNLWGWGDNRHYDIGYEAEKDKQITPIIIPVKCYVTYYDGYQKASDVVKLGEASTAPELTKTGYTLSWDKDFSNVTQNMRVNAVWTANLTYKVEHYQQNTTLNGYTVNDTENLSAPKDSEVSATAKTYEGFTENKTTTLRVPSGTVVTDGSLVLKLYYDRNSYHVALNSNSGIINSGNVTSYTYGVGAILPTNVTKTGYTFEGWFDNSELSGTAVTSISQSETGDKTYFAKWNINTYTVTFKNGTETVDTQIVNYGSNITAPSLNKAGYTLSWDKSPTNITEDTTINAVWIPNTNTSYKIEHYKQNTSLNGYDLSETENLTGTTDNTVTATAKTYTGFMQNTTTTSRIPSGTISGDGSLVLKLYYDRNSYNVTLNTNGGTVNAGNVTSYVYGVGAILPNATKTGYTFVGWFDNNELLGTVKTNITITDAENKTYYAKWNANTGTAYKVEHYKQNVAQNGYVLSETENLFGTTEENAVATTKTYEGFTENTSNSNRIVEGTIKANGSLVLKLYYDRNTYNVTLNTNDGTINAGNVTSYTYGVGATLPTNVTKTGYIFVGWYNNEELSGTVVTSISQVETGIKTYYAKWKLNQFTVTFKDGELTKDIQTINYGEAATAPNITKTGYTLSWDKPFNNVTNDLTVNAVWTINTYTVTFKDGNETVDIQTVNHGSNVTAPSVTKENYTLSWDKNLTNITGNTTINAVWTLIPYTLTSNVYNVDSVCISKVKPETKKADFISRFETNGMIAKVTDANGNEIYDEGIITTESTLHIEYEGKVYEHKIAVLGDLDNNGKITITDLSVINQGLTGGVILDTLHERAGDLDFNKKMTVTDLSILNQAMVGAIEL